jgi:RNAse (barnase) inhibitor barstar
MAKEALNGLMDANRGGVFFVPSHLEVKDVQAAAKKAGFAFFHIEGKAIARKEQLLNHAATAMHFPDYHGGNWDAFEECVTDLSWVEAEGCVLYYDHFDPLQASHPEQLETFVEIMKDAVRELKADGRVMITLLSGTKAPKGVARLAKSPSPDD